MSFNSFGSSIKLNSVKTYNGVNTSATTSFKNTFYSDIEDIDYSKYEEIDYNALDLEKGIEEAKEKANEQPWYKTIFDYTQTIRSSFNWGILEVVENIGDGLIMLGSASMAVRASVVDSIFGTSYADKIKETASNMIAYDWTEAGYQAEMKALGVSEEIANGMAHTIAGGIGTTAGYVAMSFIPGGAAVTATAGALSAVGSSSEMVFNSGATYEEALTVSMVAAVAGGVSGGALNKIGTAARGATSLLQVGVYATAGAGVSMLEPVVNTTAQYYTYGKDMVDENGNKLYDNWGDYYVESGGALNTAIAGVAGGFSTGTQSFKSYKGVKNYKKDVLSTMENSSRYDIAKGEYEALNGEDSFKKLSPETQKKHMSLVDEKELSEKIKDNQKIVNNSVKNAGVQYKDGVFNKKYTVGEILEGYKEDQMKFWSAEGYKAWKDDFGKFVDSNGNIKVYSFQDGSIGSSNIVTYGGNTSLPEGSFVMSERQYLDLLADRTVFDSKGNCINPEKLSDLTGGCNFGAGKNIIAVEQTVKLEDITLTSGGHPNAYPGWWSPGGKTVTKSGVGYCTEGIAPYNNYKNGNVNIISHNSRYNTKYYTNPLTR